MARKFMQGHYAPVNPEKYVGHIKKITYRSSWERKFMRWCDFNPSVLKWSSETVKIPYYSPVDQRERQYHVDFIITQLCRDGTKKSLLIEIKPESQMKAPRLTSGMSDATKADKIYTWSVNQAKWEAAKKWAAKRGMHFVVMGEEALGINK